MHRGIFLFALLVSALLPACKENREQGVTAGENSRPIRVPIAIARVSDEPANFEAIGVVRAETAGTIASEVQARVIAIPVREGDRVRQGDLLARLDAERVREQLRQSEAVTAEARQAEKAAAAGLDAARAGADLALVIRNRYQSLSDEDAVSRQEFDQAEARLAETRAGREQAKRLLAAATDRIRQAEAALAAARITLSDTEVRAPYDGMVTARFIEAGSLAAPGTPLLALEKTGGRRADIFVPESLVQTVRLGEVISVSVPAASATPLSGSVLAIEPVADPKSRTFVVQIGLPETTVIRSGMFARAFIPAGMAKKLLVPGPAIVRQGQLAGVYVVDGNNVARFRLVRPGAMIGERVEILSGLAGEERFVAAEVFGIADGIRVEAGP